MTKQQVSYLSVFPFLTFHRFTLCRPGINLCSALADKSDAPYFSDFHRKMKCSFFCAHICWCAPHSGDSKERKVENMQVNRFLSVTGHTHTHKRFLGLDAGTKKDFSTKVILICSILLFCFFCCMCRCLHSQKHSCIPITSEDMPSTYIEN